MLSWLIILSLICPFQRRCVNRDEAKPHPLERTYDVCMYVIIIVVVVIVVFTRDYGFTN